MGRACGCCSGSAVCKNISTRFCTPWYAYYDIPIQSNPNTIFNYSIASSSGDYKSIAFDIDVSTQICEGYAPDCAYWTNGIPAGDPPSVAVPGLCGTVFPGETPFAGQLISNCLGSFWQAGNSPGVWSFLPCTTFGPVKISVGINKIIKINPGTYTINLSGSDYSGTMLSFSTNCFTESSSVIQNTSCVNSDKKFSLFTKNFEPVGGNVKYTILNGPIYVSTLGFPCSEYAAFSYPINGTGYIVISGIKNNYSITFSVESKCYLAIQHLGGQFTKTETTQQECTCPNGSKFMVPVKQTVTQPPSFSMSISVDGDGIEKCNLFPAYVYQQYNSSHPSILDNICGN